MKWIASAAIAFIIASCSEAKRVGVVVKCDSCRVTAMLADSLVHAEVNDSWAWIWMAAPSDSLFLSIHDVEFSDMAFATVTSDGETVFYKHCLDPASCSLSYAGPIAPTSARP